MDDQTFSDGDMSSRSSDGRVPPGEERSPSRDCIVPPGDVNVKSESFGEAASMSTNELDEALIKRCC